MRTRVQPTHRPADWVPDPVHLAIIAHRFAWDAYRANGAYLDAIGQGGLNALVRPSQEAETAGVQAVLAAPCESLEAAAALASHLQWYAEAYPAAHDGKASSDRLDLEARLSDLLMFLGRTPAGETGPLAAAIETHRAAVAAFAARRREASGYDEVWQDALWAAHDAGYDLLKVPCGSLDGARELLAYLTDFLPLLDATDGEALADGAAGYDDALRAKMVELQALLAVGAEEEGAGPPWPMAAARWSAGPAWTTRQEQAQ